MAIRWKKYEMYGPKKPGVIKKCFWFCKEKCTTITGLRCVGYFADDFYEYIYRVDFQRGLFVDSRFIFVWNHQFGFLGLYGKAD